MRRLLTIGMLLGLLAAPAACGGGDTDAVSATTSAPTTTAIPATAPAPSTTATPESEAGPFVEWDVPYASTTWSGETLTLDIHFPAEPGDAPIVINPPPLGFKLMGEAIVVDFDAGAYPYESEEDILSDRGVAVRAFVEEYACAIRFVRMRAAELGNEDPIVVVAGFSVDGGRVAHVALAGATLETRWDEFTAKGGPSRQVECEAAGGSTHVDAMIGMAGAYDMFVPIYDGKWGLTYQQEHEPELQAFLAGVIGANPDLAVRLFHGTSDPLIPLVNSEEFAELLEDAGYDVQLATFRGGHQMPPAGLSLPIIMELLGR